MLVTRRMGSIRRSRQRKRTFRFRTFLDCHKKRKVLTCEYDRWMFDGFARVCVLEWCEKYNKDLKRAAWLWHDRQQDINEWFFFKPKQEETKSGETLRLEQQDAFGHRIVHEHTVPPIYGGWFYGLRGIDWQASCPGCRPSPSSPIAAPILA